jgi:DNA-directed RNA polymerase specialized sigma24 family protein
MPGHAPTNDVLYAALDELRGAPEPAHPRHAAAWRVVGTFLKRIDPRSEEDLRQETLIKVLRNVGGFAGRTPGEAVAWLRTVHRNLARDVWRGSEHEPVRVALLEERARATDEARLVDRLEAPDHRPARQRDAALEGARDALFTRLESHLEPLNLRADVCAMRRLHARVAWLRLVAESDAAELERAVQPVEVSSSAQLYKWVERGRLLLIEVLDAWIPTLDGETAEDDLHELTTLRGIFAARRADAGVPRENRRKD